MSAGRPIGRLIAAACVAGAVAGAEPAGAQVVSGVVTDSATGRPVAGATVVVRSARDSVFLRGAVTGDGGRFSIVLLQPDTVVTSVRRIGYRTASAPPQFVAAGATRSYVMALSPLLASLDTVYANAKLTLRGMFYELTAGQEWFAQHAAAGKGFFISGAELRVSGMSPCDFLNEMPGFELAGVLPTGVSGIGCYRQRTGPHRWVIPSDRASCVEGYLDRRYRLVGVDSGHFVTTSPAGGELTWHRLDRIRGVELFARYEDRPRDFSAPPAEPLKELGGMSPRTGMRTVGSKIASERPRSTNDFSRGGQQRCALILVWTQRYWGE